MSSRTERRIVPPSASRNHAPTRRMGEIAVRLHQFGLETVPIARWILVSPSRRKDAPRAHARPRGGTTPPLRRGSGASGPSCRGARGAGPRSVMLLSEGRPTAPARRFGGSRRWGTASRASWASLLRSRSRASGRPSRSSDEHRRPKEAAGAADSSGPSSTGIVAAVLIGFVGAGLMGSGMVRNLADAGHEVRLYARSPSRAARDLPATLVGLDRRGGRRRGPDVLVRDRLGRRARGRRRRARGGRRRRRRSSR